MFYVYKWSQETKHRGPFYIIVITVDRLQKNRLYDTSKERWICKLKLCIWCELHNYALRVSELQAISQELHNSFGSKQVPKKAHQNLSSAFFSFFFKEWLQGTLEMSLSPLAAIAKSPCSLDRCFYFKKHLEWIFSAMLNRLALPHKKSFLPPAPTHSSPQAQVILFLAQKEVSRETVKGGVPQSWPTTFLHTFNKTIIFKDLCFLKIEDFNQEAQWITGGNAVVDEKDDSRFGAARTGKT